MTFSETGRARDASRPVFFISLIVVALAAHAVIAQQVPPAPTAPTPATQMPATPQGQTPPVAQAPAAPAPPTTPAGPPKPAGPALAFTSDAGLVVFTVRAEGASDFEAYFAKVKEGLWKGAKPEYEQMAKGWILFKVAEGPQAGQILYWSIMNPAVKGADYDPVKILSDVFPEEALALNARLKDALVSVNRVNLQTAKNMRVGCYLAGILPCYELKPPPPPPARPQAAIVRSSG